MQGWGGGPLHPASPPHFPSPGLWERLLEPLFPNSQAQSSMGWLVRSSGELLAWCSSAEKEPAVGGQARMGLSDSNHRLQAGSVLPVLTLLLFGLPSFCRGHRQARGRETPAAADAVWTGPGAGEPGQRGWETPDSWGLRAWPGCGAARQFRNEGAIEGAGVGEQGHTGAAGVPGDHCGKKRQEELW